MPSRWILLFFALSFHKSYAADNKCMIHTPIMKLANSCYGGDMSKVASEGKFTGSLDSSGVNYCYNTLLFTSSSGGKNKIEALYENSSKQLRMQTYYVTANDIADKAQPTVLLSGMNGKCFARQNKNRECSGGFLGMGSTDLPTAVSFDIAANGYSLKGITRDRGQIKESKSLQGSSDINAAATNERIRRDVITRIRKRMDALLADQRQPAVIAAEARDFRNCIYMFNDYIMVNKQPDTYTKADNEKLARVMSKLGLRGTNNAAPTGPQEASASFQ